MRSDGDGDAEAAPTDFTDAEGGDRRHLRMYHSLLHRPHSTAAELANATGLELPQARELLSRLQRESLASPSGGTGDSFDDVRWDALQPRDRFEDDLIREQERIGQLRDRYRELRYLNEVFWRERTSQHYDGIEVIYDRSETFEMLCDLQSRAHHHIRVFDRPPYYSEVDPVQVALQQKIQREGMARGVVYRAIYEPELWARPLHTDIALTAIARGEQARVLDGLPMKLFLIDDDRAVVPLDPEHHSDSATVIVYPSGLLRALAAIFEYYWSQATPVTTQGKPLEVEDLTERERAVLTLLSAGANDDLIARRLSLSRSTVTRVVTDLEHRLGAVSRFQCGAQAVRRGWI